MWLSEVSLKRERNWVKNWFFWSLIYWFFYYTFLILDLYFTLIMIFGNSSWQYKIK